MPTLDAHPDASSFEVVERLTGSVDRVGAEGRAAALATRSLKKDSKLWGLDLAIRCCDLTTLEGSDSAGRIRQLAAKARRPAPGDASIPHVAALCVYPRLVADAVRALDGSAVAVASVATAFPSGQSSLELRLAEIGEAVAGGATEIDMVISRGALLAGDEIAVFDEVSRSKQASGRAHLKVILETGELGSYERMRRAALIAMAAGADFVKTSTGFAPGGATHDDLRLMRANTSPHIGVKAAGGVRTLDALLEVMALGTTRIGATATKTIIDDFRARKAGLAPAGATGSGSAGVAGEGGSY
jgi:deoxyribose-phosphate aldolase